MKWVYLDLSSQECKSKQFPAVDITKLFCAVLVVISHTSPLNSVNKYLNYGLVQYLARLAVPFFFVASGYFCFRKTQLENFELRLSSQVQRLMQENFFRRFPAQAFARAAIEQHRYSIHIILCHLSK